MSELSRRQAEQTLALLRTHAPTADWQFVGVRTQGDLTTRPLTEVGGQGVFASALERALSVQEIDLAVHSLKDLPVDLAPGLAVVAMLEREAPWDCLVGSALAQLPEHARIGTGSPRRARQILRVRPDLEVVPIRGNVPTRLSRVERGEVAAAVVALAGLRRLGLDKWASEVLSAEVCLPAPGQAAIALEARQADALPGVGALEHRPTRLAVEAERELLSRLGGGCLTALGCLAEPAGHGRLRLRARLVGKGGETIETDLTGAAAAVAGQVADELKAHGADRLLAEDG